MNEKNAENRRLSEQETVFVTEYVKSLNATYAVKKAKFETIAPEQYGSDLLRKPYIRDAVDNILNNLIPDKKALKKRLVDEIQKLAFSDIKNVSKWTAEEMTFIPSDELEDRESSTIQEISTEYTENGVKKKMKLFDKPKAMDMLGKYLKLFDDVSGDTEKEAEPNFPSLTKEQAQELLNQRKKKP